ncbi:MAG: folate family ECF transporter S component [Oscillospiraceae bacterium]|nr:folate family ECF transporter S component [Oscillospiraceae bacterium]MCR4759628.1 folate family ECF transporter S component [Oscillospiraceae bacterium]
MKNSTAVRSSLTVLKDVRVLTLMALLAAMSIVFGKLLAFNIGPTIRISFENLPLLMAGIFLGAPAGFLVGVMADVIGCLIVGYSINPIITLGAGCIGLIAGLAYSALQKAGLTERIAVSVMSAHVIGSMFIKSVGLMVYYSYSLPMVLPRVPLYLAIGTVESMIIILLMKNRIFAEQVERLRRK